MLKHLEKSKCFFVAKKQKGGRHEEANEKEIRYLVRIQGLITVNNNLMDKIEYQQKLEKMYFFKKTKNL
ncbi:hypothetical protein ACTGWZ_05755 [Streptococcus suis]